MSNIKDHGAFDDGAVDFAEFAYGAGAKRCNCKKARCLKLYCVCFSAGVYCGSCACRDCLNTPENQDLVLTERSKKLAASPGAFAPKVEVTGEGEMACHKKGCRCRRSRCVKKYCECFDAQVYCSSSCRCEACLNMPTAGAAGMASLPLIPMSLGTGSSAELMARLPSVGSGSGGPQDNALAAVTSAAAAIENSVDMALEHHVAGLLAGPRDGIATAGLSQVTHRSLSFAVAPGAGPFLLSLQTGHQGLSGLTLLGNRGACGNMLNAPGGEVAVDGTELGGPPVRDEGAAGDGAAKAVTSDRALKASPGVASDPLVPKPLKCQSSASACMFAEAEAALGPEVQIAPADAHADAAPQPAGPSSTAAAGPGETGSAAGGLSEDASPATRAASPACPDAEIAAPVPPEPGLTAQRSGSDSKLSGSKLEVTAEEMTHERRQPRQRLESPSSSHDMPHVEGEPPRAVAGPRDTSLPCPAPDLRQLTPVVAAGTDNTGELPPMKAEQQCQQTAAAAVAAAAAAADNPSAAATYLIAAANADEAAGAAEALPDDEDFIPDSSSGGGGRASGTLLAMEAVLAAPTLLLEEPQRAEALAAQLGLDVPQQLAARKAAHIIRTLLCMASSAVRLTRRGALVSGSHWIPPCAVASGEADHRDEHRAIQHLQGLQPDPSGAEVLPGSVADKGGSDREGAPRHGTQPDRIRKVQPLHMQPLPLSCGPGGSFTGTLRLGHGSYRFQAVGRQGGPETSGVSISQAEGNAVLTGTDAAVAGAVAVAVAGGANAPRPDAGAGGSKEAARQPSADPETSYSQRHGEIQSGPPGREGGAAAAHARRNGEERPLRRGSRIKRPNTLLAGMALEEGLDELVTGRMDRRHHSQEALGHARRQENHQPQPQPHPHCHQQRHRTASPSMEPPSPKRARLSSAQAGSRVGGSMRGRVAQPMGGRSRRASWRGSKAGEEDEADEPSDDSEPGRQAAVSLAATTWRQSQWPPHPPHRFRAAAVLDADGSAAREPGPPRSQDPRPASAARLPRAVPVPVPASQKRPLAVVGTDIVINGEPDVHGEEEKDDDDDEKETGDEEIQEDEMEEEEDGEGEIEDESREDSGGNGEEEMLAMQALFDLRAASGAPQVPGGAQRQKGLRGLQRFPVPFSAQRLAAAAGPQRPVLPGLAAQQLLRVWPNPLFLGYALPPAMWW